MTETRKCRGHVGNYLFQLMDQKIMENKRDCIKNINDAISMCFICIIKGRELMLLPKKNPYYQVQMAI